MRKSIILIVVFLLAASVGAAVPGGMDSETAVIEHVQSKSKVGEIIKINTPPGLTGENGDDVMRILKKKLPGIVGEDCDDGNAAVHPRCTADDGRKGLNTVNVKVVAVNCDHRCGDDVIGEIILGEDRDTLLDAVAELVQQAQDYNSSRSNKPRS